MVEQDLNPGLSAARALRTSLGANTVLTFVPSLLLCLVLPAGDSFFSDRPWSGMKLRPRQGKWLPKIPSWPGEMLGAEVWAPASQLFWSQFQLRKMASKYLLLNCSARRCICTALISSSYQCCKVLLASFFR